MKEQLFVQHLNNRPAELKEAKKKGTKVIGYFPGNYVPEELIYASGAIPICLCHGGNSKSAEKALTVVPSVICPFARSQIGEKITKQNSYYNMVDMLIAPITCQHLKKAAEVWEYYGDVKIFKLGVPQQHENDFEVQYYVDRLKTLKDTLQEFTGNCITEEKIKSAIELYNRMRELLKEISQSRRASPSLISSLEFVKLNHASLYADPVFMLDALEQIYLDLKGKKTHVRDNSPRILLLGPNISYGDYSVLEMVQEAGGNIVIEEISEGI